MAESSSPEVPKQRKKPLGLAPALPDSSSPAPARRFKVKRIESPAVPAQIAPAAQGRKGKTKRSTFVKSKFLDLQCREVGKSDGSASNSSDDGHKTDLSCVSAGQDHPDGEKFVYLQGMGSQTNMPPPLQATRFIEEDRSPLADRIERRILAQQAERRAKREADLAKVRLAALARKALSPILCSADVLANLLSPTRPTLPEAAMAVTFSAVRVIHAVDPQLPSPSNTSSMLPMQPDKPRHARLKLKTGLGPSKPPPSAAACPPSHLAYPPPKLKEAPSEPKTPSKTPSKLILDDEMNSPSRSVKSSAAKSSPLSRLNLDSSPVQYNSKRIICLSQELALLAVDDSPVSRSEAFRALMAANPGFYGFSTGTQIDRVQQHSRETQTSPMRTSGLTVEDLRDELGKANRALLMAFGF